MTAAELLKFCPGMSIGVATLIADIHQVEIERARLEGEFAGYERGYHDGIKTLDHLLEEAA